MCIDLFRSIDWRSLNKQRFKFTIPRLTLDDFLPLLPWDAYCQGCHPTVESTWLDGSILPDSANRSVLHTVCVCCVVFSSSSIEVQEYFSSRRVVLPYSMSTVTSDQGLVWVTWNKKANHNSHFGCKRFKGQ